MENLKIFLISIIIVFIILIWILANHEKNWYDYKYLNISKLEISHQNKVVTVKDNYMIPWAIVWWAWGYLLSKDKKIENAIAWWLWWWAIWSSISTSDTKNVDEYKYLVTTENWGYFICNEDYYCGHNNTLWQTINLDLTTMQIVIKLPK